jgi:hypothetical protein
MLDFASAVSRLQREDLGWEYQEVMHVGRQGHFLQALRHYTEGTRENIPSEISQLRMRKLAGIFGLNYIDIAQLQLSSGKNIVEMLDSERVRINIERQEEVVYCCHRTWLKVENDGFIDDKNKLLVILLTELRVPNQEQHIMKKYKQKELVRTVLDDLEKLGLLKSMGKYYFNLEIFRDIDEGTLDLITEYNILPNQLMETMQQVAETPGFPLEMIEDSIRCPLLELGVLGILVPIGIESPNYPTKYFVFSDPKNQVNGNLSYETAAYIRFNECYASPIHGRLTMSIKYLDRLIDNGIAGDATNIGFNYQPLQFKGVIKVVEGQTFNRYMMVLRKLDVVQDAKNILETSCDEILTWKEPPTWISDPASARAAETKMMKESMANLRDFIKDYG